MARCGLNVPPGLTVTTEVCQEFYKVGEHLSCDARSPSVPEANLTVYMHNQSPFLLQ